MLVFDGRCLFPSVYLDTARFTMSIMFFCSFVARFFFLHFYIYFFFFFSSSRPSEYVCIRLSLGVFFEQRNYSFIWLDISHKNVIERERDKTENTIFFRHFLLVPSMRGRYTSSSPRLNTVRMTIIVLMIVYIYDRRFQARNRGEEEGKRRGRFFLFFSILLKSTHKVNAPMLCKRQIDKVENHRKMSSRGKEKKSINFSSVLNRVYNTNEKSNFFNMMFVVWI